MPFQLPPAFLNIVDSPQSGYKQATDKNGNIIPYWYVFTGGSDGNGSMHVSLGLNGDGQMAVSLPAVSTYLIKTVLIMDNGVPLPPGDPVFSTAIATNGLSCNIIDWITKQPGIPNQNYYYQITVEDTRPGKNNQLIVVDPTILNRPLTLIQNLA